MVEILASTPLALTLKVSAISMLLQVVFGVPIGLFLAEKKSVFRQVIDVLVTLPMIFPPMALGFFLLLVFGRNGLIGKTLLDVFNFKIIFTFWGVLIAVFTVGLPFMVKSVQTARQQLPPSIVEAALTLGKSRWTIIRKVILPNIKGGISTGLLLSFGRSLGEVGISLMLGGNIIGRTETLSLAIYNSVFEGDLKMATQLSVLLSVLAISIILFLNINARKLFINLKKAVST